MCGSVAIGQIGSERPWTKSLTKVSPILSDNLLLLNVHQCLANINAAKVVIIYTIITPVIARPIATKTKTTSTFVTA